MSFYTYTYKLFYRTLSLTLHLCCGMTSFFLTFSYFIGQHIFYTYFIEYHSYTHFVGWFRFSFTHLIQFCQFMIAVIGIMWLQKCFYNDLWKYRSIQAKYILRLYCTWMQSCLVCPGSLPPCLCWWDDSQVSGSAVTDCGISLRPSM